MPTSDSYDFDDERPIFFRTRKAIRELLVAIGISRPMKDDGTPGERHTGRLLVLIGGVAGLWLLSTMIAIVPAGSEGIPVTLVDTAGLRPVEDPVEAEGVRRAHAAAAEADVSLLVLDATRDVNSDEQRALDASATRPGLVVANKADLLRKSEPPRYPRALPISVRTGLGWDAFRAALRQTLLVGHTGDGAALTNVRHAVALERAVAALVRGHAAADDGLSDEAVLLDLREALDALGEITGEVGTEELYDRIFATFCIGK